MPLFIDSGPRMRLEEFRLLRDLVNTFSGIELADDARFGVERRLRERLTALELDTFESYLRYLRHHPNGKRELEHAVDVITTNETYFFREQSQLRAFEKDVLPAIRNNAGKRRQLGIWSAGCSTGEEVYTLAILIAESGLFDDWNVRIFGNDISRQVLQIARRGVYRESSFRAMPERHRKHFVHTPEGWEVEPRIRAMCHFGHFNLLDAGRAAIVGRVDVIFCRNVLIYLDQAARRSVIESFYDRLHAGGYLMLGHSESLLNLSTAFELAHLSTDLAYRKPLLSASWPPGGEHES